MLTKPSGSVHLVSLFFSGTRRYTVHADPVLTVDYNVKVRKSK